MKYGCYLLSLSAILLLCACGDDDPTTPEVEGQSGLTGTWTLGSWEWTRAMGPAQTVDWVVTQGLTGTLEIAADGDFTAAPALPGGFGADHGTLTAEGDSIYWDGENDEEWVTYTLTSDILTLTWPEEEFVDMDLDGRPEDAWLVASYTR